MPIRKWYEQVLQEVEALKANLDKAADFDESGEDIAKRYQAMLKKADAVADGGKATLNDMKPFEKDFKSLKKEFEKWKTEFVDWRQQLADSITAIDDLATKITDRTKELTKTEREHIEKHRQRIAAADVRVQTAIKAMLQVEEQRFDDKIRAEKQRKKDEGDDYDPSTAAIDINAKFDRAAKTTEITAKVKHNAAEAKAIDAAKVRIEVYEKIRQKKVKKYEDIKQGLLDVKHNYGVEKIL